VRILYLCHRIPYPPNKGEKIRAFHQVKGLSARHEVDLFTLADQPADLEGQAALKPYCRQIAVCSVRPAVARLRALPYLLTETPLTVPYFYSAELQGAVDSALRRHSYDRIFVYCSAMAQYVKGCRDTPIVTDLVDVDSDKWTQYASHRRFPWSAVYRREGRMLRRLEQEVSETSACVLVTTEREAGLLRRISGRANVQVVPNGVDPDYFRASPRTRPSPPTIVFTGDMSYFPNQQAVRYFAQRVFPLVRKAAPDARFLIVGRNPGQSVVALREIDGIEVTGSVPDVRTYLAMATVSVAPFSIASGIQNKILEAMAFGLPVAGTRRAVQGLSAAVARIVEIGDDAETLADKMIALLRDPELARGIGQESRRRVAADYSWEPILQQLVSLVENPWRQDAPARDAALLKVNGD
jgi:sugar transferase (PEP-CTERM/EpsH1 system associated)